MSKLSLADLANIQNDTTATTTINSNSDLIETAMENTLSRDGTSPNQMGANLDMNNNKILNLPAPLTATEPLRLQDLITFNGGGTIGGGGGGVDDPTTDLPAGGTTGQVLTKTSNSDYAVNWQTPAMGGGAVTSLQGLTGDLTNFYFPPQGRLTIFTGTPVMTTSHLNQIRVYYTPYVGNLVPIYDGTRMVPTVVNEISVLTTDTTKNPAAIGANKVNDWFVWNDTGTIRLTHGPDWTDPVTRPAPLTRINGIWTNPSTITNGPATNKGTYVGTTLSNGSNLIDWGLGSTNQAGILGVWNMYNRVLVSASVVDTNAYTYTNASTRQARNSTNNQVSIVTGYAEDTISAIYSNGIAFAAADAVVDVGIGLDSVGTFNGYSAFDTGSATSAGARLVASIFMSPMQGLHVVSANEAGDGLNANSFNAVGDALLTVSTRM